MNNFEYYAPTKVVFGKGAEEKIGTLVAQQGCKKALIHYGGQSAVKSGLIERVCAALDAEGIAYVTLGGVKPNPRLSLVREGIKLCRENGVDFVLAVGGGSVIDSSKAIGYGVANEGDVWDFYMMKRTPQACLPIGAVLTIAAAGSEMSDSSVITNDDGDEANWYKRGTNCALCRCKFAALNPELTYTLPQYQTRCGCTDILMHTMERYFGGDAAMQLTDGIAEALMRTVLAAARVLEKEPQNYDARAEVMWASSLSHNGLTGCGTNGGDWASHKLEHEVGARFDVAHGAGLAAIWGTWARYVYKLLPARFAKFAVNVLGVAAKQTDEETALAGIEAMEAFYREIGMPTSLAELGVTITETDAEAMAEKATLNGKIALGGTKKLYKDDIVKIYMAAR